ncbi:energy transducer TonB [Luteimonas saliphila]|uniref:energy transducer TonB n=1 Tax=Luteimonas saliphila TaxID=2804919 RepID=UPI00192D5D67|nr:energy transducer TonB [Luteimonas saliphila]
MVLQQTHSVPRKAQPSRLDFNRILGISSTLALNVLALSFLLMPMTMPSPPSVVERTPGLIVVDIVPIKPATPPPEVVEIVRPKPQPQPSVRETPASRPAIEAPVLVDQGIALPETMVDAPPANDAPPSIEPSGPVLGMQLQYESAPSPAYPRAAIQRNLEGTVLLRVLVGTDGSPLEVGIERSSGHGVLDREAVRHVQHSWRFRPAMRDGQAVQAIGLVPIEFKLDRG